MDLLAINTRVKLVHQTMARKGKIVGHAITNHPHDDAPRLTYLVELDEGFFSPERDTYIGTMVCGRHALQVI